MKKLMIAVLSIFLISCTSHSNSDANFPLASTKTEYPITTPIIIQYINPPIYVNSTPYDYKADYKDIYFIHFYGDIDKDKILNMIYSINHNHFDGVKELDFIHSNKKDLRNAGVFNGNDGFTTPNKIEVYIYNETNSEIYYLLLHELKHEYCYLHGDLEFTHTGCFLNTPIDKEYGFVK